jgi:hypothetical protein
MDRTCFTGAGPGPAPISQMPVIEGHCLGWRREAIRCAN